MIKLIKSCEKKMSNGMRDMSYTNLTDEEIEYVKSEIRQIKADEAVFIFNDEAHKYSSTCYNFQEDKIYITRNVFQDTKYGSTHPRDLMSVRAVLAHEYYGHRPYREEYIADYKKSKEFDIDFHTTEIWEDECRASITAAKCTPNLTQQDKSNLVLDAIYRAEEFNHYIEMDDFMKEVIYGYKPEEKNISYANTRIKFVSKTSEERDNTKWTNINQMSKMRHHSKDDDFGER